MKRITLFLSFLIYGLTGTLYLYPQSGKTVVINAGKPIVEIQQKEANPILSRF
jgi:hypothetical protein